MSAGYKVGYPIMYRLGITPWVHGEPPEPLAALIEGPQSLPPGDMLDVGCGTGQDAIYAARHNWSVTGLETRPRLLRAWGLNLSTRGSSGRRCCSSPFAPAASGATQPVQRSRVRMPSHVLNAASWDSAAVSYRARPTTW